MTDRGPRGQSSGVEPETREALERLERGPREEIQTSAAASRDETRRLIAESGDETRGLIAGVRDETRGLIAEAREETRGLIAEAREETRGLIANAVAETRRHFDVVGESLRGDIRTLAEGVMAFADASLRRDTELGDRIDRLDQRVLGLETRVSVLERSRLPRRRRR